MEKSKCKVCGKVTQVIGADLCNGCENVISLIFSLQGNKNPSEAERKELIKEMITGKWVSTVAMHGLGYAIYSIISPGGPLQDLVEFCGIAGGWHLLKFGVRKLVQMTDDNEDFKKLKSRMLNKKEDKQE